MQTLPKKFTLELTELQALYMIALMNLGYGTLGAATPYEMQSAQRVVEILLNRYSEPEEGPLADLCRTIDNMKREINETDLAISLAF